MNKTLLMFDLDGTLLSSQKTVTPLTLEAIQRVRKAGVLIGLCTSRSALNALPFEDLIAPDVMISSGGALIRRGGKTIFKAAFPPAEVLSMIETARRICGRDVEITNENENHHYWNYSIDPLSEDPSWGQSLWTDYHDYSEESLKMCVQIPSNLQAEELKAAFTACDCHRFSDGCWYKFTRKGVTKAHALALCCEELDIDVKDVIAFGDDFADIDILDLAGLGVAMGNAIEEVKNSADLVIGSNDEDGIAHFLLRHFSL